MIIAAPGQGKKIHDEVQKIAELHSHIGEHGYQTFNDRLLVCPISKYGATFSHNGKQSLVQESKGA